MNINSNTGVASSCGRSMRNMRKNSSSDLGLHGVCEKQIHSTQSLASLSSLAAGGVIPPGTMTAPVGTPAHLHMNMNTNNTSNPNHVTCGMSNNGNNGYNKPVKHLINKGGLKAPPQMESISGSLNMSLNALTHTSSISSNASHITGTGTY